MRAMDAIRFGTGIRHDGYNLFVLGPSGIGKSSMVRRFLEQKAGGEHKPDDWCYINNFDQPHKPHVLRLPSGKGEELRSRMEQLVEYLRSAIPALFESDEYHAKVSAIQEEFSKRQEQAFNELGDVAAGAADRVVALARGIRLCADARRRGDATRRIREVARGREASRWTRRSSCCRSSWKRSCGRCRNGAGSITTASSSLTAKPRCRRSNIW